ncbi:MAG: rhomboid family intramembrane serine protease [Myxococcales bacterium]|nr:rhomboid family intramembrane serine protease [Myxococcales bacterium]
MSEFGSQPVAPTIKLRASFIDRVLARVGRAFGLFFLWMFLFLGMAIVRVAVVDASHKKMSDGVGNAFMLVSLALTIIFFLWARRRPFGVRKSELHLLDDHYAVGNGKHMFASSYDKLRKLEVRAFDGSAAGGALAGSWVIRLVAPGIGGVRVTAARPEAIAAIAHLWSRRPDLELNAPALMIAAIEREVLARHAAKQRLAAVGDSSDATGAAEIAPSNEAHDVPQAPHLDHEVFKRKPWVTGAIAAICVVLFALGKYWGDGLDSAALWRMGANSGEYVREHGQWWRLMASAFLHANLMHLVFNMAALLTFGPLLEKLLGAPRYVVLYVASALAGSLASAWLSSAGMSVGASGAIWGLMAAGVALTLWPRGLLPAEVLSTARQQAMIPLALNIMYSFKPGIDVHAHFGGGALGFALMAAGVLTRGIAPLWGTTVANVGSDVGGEAPGGAAHDFFGKLAIGLAVLSCASLGLAMQNGKPWALREEPGLTSVHIKEARLTVEIPVELLTAKVVEVKGEATITAFGNLGRFPLAVEVVAEPVGESYTADDVPLLLKVSRKQFEQGVPANMKLVGAVTDETIAGWPYLRARYTIGAEATVDAWLTFIGDQNLVVRVYAPTDLPEAWEAAKVQISKSLKPDVAPMVRPAEVVVDAAFWKACKTTVAFGEQVALDCSAVWLKYIPPAGDDVVLSSSEREANVAKMLLALDEDYEAKSPVPIVLAAPHSTATASPIVNRADATMTVQGIYATGSNGTQVICLDERPPGAAQPSCADLTAHLLVHGVPQGK